jgi:uncharacterized protein YkwD
MFATHAHAARRITTSVAALAIAASAFLIPQFSTSAGATTTASRTSATALARYEVNMLKLMNRERTAHGAKPVVMNKKLALSAHRHNVHMAKANTMSHQLPGEAFFADRISKTGYNWRAAGENIGWNSNLSNQGVQTLQRQMYNEKAPNNGHRLNILDKHFTQVGIDVYYDAAHNKLWFTQDFAQPMN